MANKYTPGGGINPAFWEIEDMEDEKAALESGIKLIIDTFNNMGSQLEFSYNSEEGISVKTLCTKIDKETADEQRNNMIEDNIALWKAKMEFIKNQKTEADRLLAEKIVCS